MFLFNQGRFGQFQSPGRRTATLSRGAVALQIATCQTDVDLFVFGVRGRTPLF